MQTKMFYFDDEDQLILTEETLKAVSDKVATLQAENPKIKKVFPIAIAGKEYDAKPIYIGYFKQPDFKIFSKYLAVAANNSAGAMKQLAEDCFVGGDHELTKDESLFLFGLMPQLGQLIEMRNGTLVNLSKPGK